MTNAPAGWYDDGTGRQRWWNGTAWTATYRDDYSKPSNLKAVRKWKRIGVAGALILLVIVAASGGWGSLFLLLGFAALAVGVFALIRGSIRPLRINSRPVAVGVLIVAFVVLATGGTVLGATNADMRASLTSLESGKDRPTAVAPSPKASAAPTPVRTVKTEVKREPIPFDTGSVDDPNLDVGTTALLTQGANGERVITYEVVYEDGVEVSRSVKSDKVGLQPVQEVTAIGTRQPPPPPAPEPVPAPAPAPAPEGGCDPNYSGPCVPTADDVDCAGGSGNGPAYVSGPVFVTGSDIYDLDRDGDGIACD